ncbi:MAG: hypothetical protein K6L75_02485 [Cellvibrionaceae bacterium]
MINNLSYQVLKEALNDNGYRFFDSGEFNLNLIGIRTSAKEANKFNDIFCVAFKQHGREMLFCFDCTTDPGEFWLENPMNNKGAAILAPGQYLGAWKIGYHLNKYPALTQVKPMIVYRDNNKDKTLDFDVPREAGLFGINCHYAAKDKKSIFVDKFSAGCQVIADHGSFDFVLSLCHLGSKSWGNSFTYTLITEDEL